MNRPLGFVHPTEGGQLLLRGFVEFRPVGEPLGCPTKVDCIRRFFCAQKPHENHWDGHENGANPQENRQTIRITSSGIGCHISWSI